MKVSINVDLNKFKYSLVGDGFTKEEVKSMTTEKLVSILTTRIQQHIDKEYTRSKNLGLLEESVRDTWATDWKSSSDFSANFKARWSFFKEE